MNPADFFKSEAVSNLKTKKPKSFNLGHIQISNFKIPTSLLTLSHRMMSRSRRKSHIGQ
jgi:hypothetical protein